MKHITGKVLAVACIALAGAALLAGANDIRKFHRMRTM
jgi:type IV secretory pathway VirB2 component (pilin)